MDRRLLLIGVGHWSLRPIDHISRVLVQRLAPSSVPTWGRIVLTPFETDAFAPLSSRPSELTSRPLSQMSHLPLSASELADLYYQPGMARWAGPNPAQWGARIAETRLWGKLTTHLYYGLILQQINEMVTQLVRRSDVILQIYLIAPLHDPFASGALLDIAYMLQKQVQAERSRVYGILLLPELRHDPLSRAYGETPESLRWQGAFTYAALRELHMMQTAPSFYINHQSRIDALAVENIAPFQSGDCYLIGGQNRQDYDTALESMANFVYLRGATSLAERVPVSEINRGFFSTFGVRLPHSQQQKTRQSSQHRYEAIVLSQWLNQSVEGAIRFDDLHRLVSYEPDTPAVTEAYRTFRQSLEELRQRALIATDTQLLLDAEDSTPNTALSADEIEALYNTSQHTLIDYEAALMQEVSLRIAAIQPLIYQTILRTALVIPLRQLIGTYTALLDGALYHQAGRATYGRTDMVGDLLDMEVMLQGEAQALSDERLHYAYVSKARASLVQALVLILVLALGASLLAIINLLVAILFLIGGAAWLILAVPRFQQRRRVHLYQALLLRQAEFLEKQPDFVRLRVQLAYLEALNRQVGAALCIDAPPPEAALTETLRLFHLRQVAQQYLASHPPSSQPLDEDERTQLTQAVGVFHEQIMTAILHPAASHPTSYLAQLQTTLSTVIQAAQQLTPQNQQDPEVLERRLQQVMTPDREMGQSQEVAERFVDLSYLNETDLPPEQREGLHRFMALINWEHQSLSTTLRASLAQHGIGIDLLRSSVPFPEDVFYVQVQCNLPLWTMFRLEAWRKAYLTLIQESPSPHKDRLYAYRALMHPMRAGIASPDITRVLLPEVVDMPFFGMALSLLLRWKASDSVMRDMCDVLSVPHTTPMNWDEFCGALQDNLKAVLDRLHMDTPVKRDTHSDAALALLSLFNSRDIANTWDYAEWEVWVSREVRRALQLYQHNVAQQAFSRPPIGLSRLMSVHQALQPPQTSQTAMPT